MVEETQRLLDLMGVPWVAAPPKGLAAVMAAKGQLDGRHPGLGRPALRFTVLVRNLMDDGTKRYGRVVHAQSIDLGEMLQGNDLAESNWWTWPS